MRGKRLFPINEKVAEDLGLIEIQKQAISFRDLLLARHLRVSLDDYLAVIQPEE